MSESRNLNSVLLFFISISGATFWFFMGFPFSHHNESYAWIYYLENSDFKDVLTKTYASNNRPLAQFLMWLLFKWSDGSLYSIQIVNYLMACIAWFILFSAAKGKRAYSLSAMIIGGVFASGYIYLFHVHGIFYSPLLIFIAFLAYLYYQQYRLIMHSFVGVIIIVFLTAIIAGLFHPFAMLVYIGFVAGLTIENYRLLSMKHKVVCIACLALSLAILKFLLTGSLFSFQQDSGANGMIKGYLMNYASLVASYKALELNSAASIIALLMGIAAIINSKLNKQTLIVSLIAFCSLSMYCHVQSFPVLIIAVAAAIMKTIRYRQWSIGMMIGISALFSLTASGSPTHSLFAVFICSLVVSQDAPPMVARIGILSNKQAAIFLMCCGLVTAAIKLNVQLPVLKNIALPILSEKERTVQLERILHWYMDSEFVKRRIVFMDTTFMPNQNMKTPLRRMTRPPTEQKYLDYYLYHCRGIDSLKQSETEERLVVTFGREKMDDKTVVYEVTGVYCRPAYVYFEK
ncbi:hypothetical protein JW979_00785 [bacterium]|nr:hypothetical protein [candidate division CSSED10-310 bacterium]